MIPYSCFSDGFRKNAKKIAVSVCLSLGNGECSAFALFREGKRYSVYPTDVHQFPTALFLALTNLEYRECVTQFFKAPPAGESTAAGGWSAVNWDSVSHHDYQTYMREYLHDLWERVEAYVSPAAGNLPYPPEQKLLTGENIAIYVGVPTSYGEWTDKTQFQQYCRFLQEITGVPNIAIVPEAFAGLLGVLKTQDDVTLDLSKKNAILDFGASRVDFTYLDQGIVKCTKSWTLGTSAIERIMLDKILTLLMVHTQAQLEKLHAGPEDSANAEQMILLRTQHDQLKELYEKGSDHPLYNSFLVHVCKNAKEEYFRLQEMGDSAELSYQLPGYGDVVIDESFMNDVLWHSPVWDVCENGDSSLGFEKADGSWIYYCREILKKCKTEIGSSVEDLRVFVVGGGGSMPFVPVFCEELLCAPVLLSQTPRDSVAYGICQLAMNHARIGFLEQKAKEYLANGSMSHIVSTMESRLVDYLYEHFCAFRSSDGALYAEIKFGDYRKKCDAYLATHVKKQEILALLEEPIRQMEKLLTERYCDLSRAFSRELYKGCITWKPSFEIKPTDKNPLPNLEYSKSFDVTLFMSEKQQRKKIFASKDFSDDEYWIHPYRYVESCHSDDKNRLFLRTVSEILYALLGIGCTASAGRRFLGKYDDIEKWAARDVQMLLQRITFLYDLSKGDEIHADRP